MHSVVSTSEARKLKGPMESCEVSLAGDVRCTWSKTPGGTLVVPEQRRGSASDTRPQTLVPLGAVVTRLGCKLTWSRTKGLRLQHPKRGLLPTKIVNGCPQLPNDVALELVQELELCNGGPREERTKELYQAVLMDHLTEDPERALKEYVSTEFPELVSLWFEEDRRIMRSEAQAANEGALPRSEAQAQAANEGASPRSEAQAQAADEGASPRSEAQAQAADEGASPRSEAQAQAADEGASPRSRAQAQAANEGALPRLPTKVHRPGQRHRLRLPTKVHCPGQRHRLRLPTKVHCPGQRRRLRSPTKVHRPGQRHRLRLPAEVRCPGQRHRLRSPMKVPCTGQRHRPV